MDAVLGLIGLAIFVAGVIGLAAGMTWLVIRISPSKDRPKKAETPAT